MNLEIIEQLRQNAEAIANQKRQLIEFLEAVRFMILPSAFEGFVIKESESKLEELGFQEKMAVCNLQERVYS